MQSLHKKNKVISSTGWISALKIEENMRKRDLVPTYLHLYHYAGNNPICYIDPDGRYSLSQFRSDVDPAINFDFGSDYSRFAQQSWYDGKYLNALIYELDSTCEFAYDFIFMYGGIKFVRAFIKAIPMIYGTLRALNSNSTVVLGRFEEGACNGYTKMASKIEAYCFQIPDKMYSLLSKIPIGDSNLAKKINEAWLNGVMKSGARIIFNFNPNDAKAGTSFYMEVQKLSVEYRFIPTVVDGIECWEAIKK